MAADQTQATGSPEHLSGAEAQRQGSVPYGTIGPGRPADAGTATPPQFIGVEERNGAYRGKPTQADENLIEGTASPDTKKPT